MSAPKGRSSNTLATIALVLMAIGAVKLGGQLGESGAPILQDPTAGPRPVAGRTSLTLEERSNIDLFRQVSPSVVHITSIEQRRSLFSRSPMEIPQGTGSGFVWDERGFIVTNFHVIRGSSRQVVTLPDSTKVEAQVVGFDPASDLAVLRVDTQGLDMPALSLGTSSDLQVGQKVFAIGNPFGFDQTLTTGIISGLDREITSVAGNRIKGVIQTDAAINPGNSGGPLLDSSGRLIGVNTAIFSPSGASAGIGFAVPVDTVNHIVPQLIAKGRASRPGLGVLLAPDTWTRSQRIPGVVIHEVNDGSSAAKAGLQGLEEDRQGRVRLGDVIIGVNGQAVSSSQELQAQLSSYQIGDQIRLNLLRDGREKTVEIRLQAID